ncbi:hypothetical protein BZG36_01930 [Bifiguratus adelaidae]|uniref:Protein YTP1-like C-terminal domain-containing protein n=1 Tax=Bifiguratus adelaidae TaxID=1938954 RepID=A0A261Y3T6_9FUNG|nr:hypothetical protein BZG36_01930 [Bifiguratus adelaidae]
MLRLGYLGLFLLILGGVVAQHDHHMDVPPQPEGEEPMSYARWEEHRGYLALHVIFMILAFVIVMPMGIMFGIARSNLHWPTQVLAALLAQIGFTFAELYGHSMPAFYEGNSHHTNGWIIWWILNLQLGIGVTRKLTKYIKSKMNGGRYEQLETVTLFDRHSDEHTSDLDDEDSQGTLHENEDYHTVRLMASPSTTTLNDPLESKPTYARTKPSFITRLVEKVAAKMMPYIPEPVQFVICKSLVNPFTEVVLRRIHQVIGRVFILLIFAQITTGVVVWEGICRSWDVLGCAAHLIKGGIFFWIGLITFARYLGAFKEYGWSWNLPDDKHKTMFSFEMIETSLIFIYGITNTWMEHFGENDAWSHKDFEHASLAFMWWWMGLAGILVESKAIRRCLDGITSTNPAGQSTDRRLSLNPFPGLTILLTGVSMGNHHQMTETGTRVHYLWGLLFTLGAICRFLTYFLMYLKSPTTNLPTRPPTEAIGAFCLVAGGIMFMASQSGTIDWMIRNDIDLMFFMNAATAVAFIILSGTAGLLAIKAWSARRQERINAANADPMTVRVGDLRQDSGIAA